MKYCLSVVVFLLAAVGLRGATPAATPPTSRGGASAATVPMRLDHNRAFVEAEFRTKAGGVRTALLWIDTGNPDFIMTAEFARDIGIDVTAEKEKAVEGRFEVPAPVGVRIGGLPVMFDGVKSQVLLKAGDEVGGMRFDANLPSTVLKRYEVMLDYPGRRFTLTLPGASRPRGTRLAAVVHPQTGIVQIDVSLDGTPRSFAIDIGASYTFLSIDLAKPLLAAHPGWPTHSGAVGCANMWGWPQEPRWTMMRASEIRVGPFALSDIGTAVFPMKEVFDWYSRKTARPVVGLLGPNVLRAFRVQFDYAGSAVYLEKAGEPAGHDADMVGLTLQPHADGSFTVLAVSAKDGQPLVDGVRTGDRLLQVDRLQTKGATMGAVVDALRGKPGEARTLVIERAGKSVTVEAKVMRLL